MDPIKDEPKEQEQALDLSNFSLQNTGKLVVQETDTKATHRKFRDGESDEKSKASSTK